MIITINLIRWDTFVEWSMDNSDGITMIVLYLKIKLNLNDLMINDRIRKKDFEIQSDIVGTNYKLLFKVFKYILKL